MSSYYRGKVTLIWYALVWVSLSVVFGMPIIWILSQFNIAISSDVALTASGLIGGIATIAYGISNDRYRKRKEELEQLKLHSEKEIEQQNLRQAVAAHIVASEQKKETVEQQELRRALASHTFDSEQKKETALSDTQPTVIKENKETPEGEDLYCTNCGKKARVNDKFCKGCGEEFTE